MGFILGEGVRWVRSRTKETKQSGASPLRFSCRTIRTWRWRRQDICRRSSVRRFQLQAFVDTAAALLVLPTDVADRLGLPKAGEALVRYADQRSATRPLVQDVRLELLGRQGVFLSVVEPGRTTALIGAVVLETLDLLVRQR